MQIDILSLFPEMFISPFAHSIIKRAIDKKLLSVVHIARYHAWRLLDSAEVPVLDEHCFVFLGIDAAECQILYR